MAVDLHAALNNIPKSLSIISSRHDRPYSNNRSEKGIGSNDVLITFITEQVDCNKSSLLLKIQK